MTCVVLWFVVNFEGFWEEDDKDPLKTIRFKHIESALKILFKSIYLVSHQN